MTDMEARIQRLRGLHDKTTNGEWCWGIGNDGKPVITAISPHIDYGRMLQADYSLANTQADAAFITAAHNEMPALFDEIKVEFDKLREENDDLRKRLERAIELPDGYEYANELFQVVNMPAWCDEDGGGCEDCKFLADNGDDCDFEPYIRSIKVKRIFDAIYTLSWLYPDRESAEAALQDRKRAEAAQEPERCPHAHTDDDGAGREWVCGKVTGGKLFCDGLGECMMPKDAAQEGEDKNG